MGRKANYHLAFDWEWKAGEEVQVRGELSPFVPGYFSGAPEDCCPDEGGELSDVEVCIAGTWISDSEFEKRFGKELAKELCDACDQEIERLE